jgi:TM2 domain-containing membrane protein YozV
MNQGFQQAGQAFGQAADQFGNAVNQGMQQQYPPGGGPMMQQPGMGGMPGAMTASGPPKQFMITLLLALFAGGFGAHRFYTGHILFGVIQLFTVGGCGVWTLIDIIMIVTGKYTDAQGRPLVKS